MRAFAMGSFFGGLMLLLVFALELHLGGSMLGFRLSFVGIGSIYLSSCVLEHWMILVRVVLLESMSWSLIHVRIAWVGVPSWQVVLHVVTWLHQQGVTINRRVEVFLESLLKVKGHLELILSLNGRGEECHSEIRLHLNTVDL